MAERCGSLLEACRRLATEPGLRPILGGTDLMVASPHERARQGRWLDLSCFDEMRGIAERGGSVWIGAATTFTALQADASIRRHFPALVAAASEVGGWQIQNRATLGGNVANASPAGDSLPVLAVLEAVVVLGSAAGDRLVERRVPYAGFHVGYRATALAPGEVILGFELPLPGPGLEQRFQKVGTRQAQAISKVVVALAGRCAGGRVQTLRLAAGSVAATPVRLRQAESAAVGLELAAAAEAAGSAARQETTPIDDVRSTAAYRSAVLGRVVRRLVLSLTPDSE